MKKSIFKQLCFFCISIVLPIFSTQMIHADIFKCSDEEGSVNYIDKPCPVDVTEKKMNHVKDSKGMRLSKETKIELESKKSNIDNTQGIDGNETFSSNTKNLPIQSSELSTIQDSGNELDVTEKNNVESNNSKGKSSVEYKIKSFSKFSKLKTY